MWKISHISRQYNGFLWEIHNPSMPRIRPHSNCAIILWKTRDSWYSDRQIGRAATFYHEGNRWPFGKVISFSVRGRRQGKRVARIWLGALPRNFDWGVGFIGTQTHLPQKFSFSSDFGHLIWKMLGKCKIVYVSRKIYWNRYLNFWGDRPRGFQKCGGRDPRDPPPPSATPLDLAKGAEVSKGPR